mmetsp:Transcript_96385/g.214762  ORF Transcript_96385/g.214762 Transcript_96385/m.214762 type:complete len:243 (+) Transcript_96385:2192-2920(+)
MLLEPQTFKKVRLPVRVCPPILHANEQPCNARLELFSFGVPSVQLVLRVPDTPWLLVPLLYILEDANDMPVHGLFHVRQGLQILRACIASRKVASELRRILPDGDATLQSAPAHVVDKLLCRILVDHKRIHLVEDENVVVIHVLVQLAPSGLLCVEGSHVPSLAIDNPCIVGNALDDIGAAPALGDCRAYFRRRCPMTWSRAAVARGRSAAVARGRRAVAAPLERRWGMLGVAADHCEAVQR